MIFPKDVLPVAIIPRTRRDSGLVFQGVGAELHNRAVALIDFEIDGVQIERGDLILIQRQSGKSGYGVDHLSHISDILSERDSWAAGILKDCFLGLIHAIPPVQPFMFWSEYINLLNVPDKTQRDLLRLQDLEKMRLNSARNSAKIGKTCGIVGRIVDLPVR